MESIFSFSCSRFYSFFCSQGAAFAQFNFLFYLTSQTALFLFLSEKAALASLPTARFVALRPPFSFRQAQFVQVFLLKPASFCKLFAVPAAPTNLPFLLPSPLRLSLCPILCVFFYLKLSQRFGKNCLLSPPLLSGYNGSPGDSFFMGNDAADELARRGMLLMPSAIPCSLSFTFRVHSSLFSDWKRTISSKFFDTQAYSFPLKNLCSLVTLAMSSLVFAAIDTAFRLALITLGLAESKILLAAPEDTRPRTHLISFCTVQLRTLYAAQHLLFGNSLFLYDLWSRPWRVAQVLGSMVFHQAPSLGRGQVATITTCKVAHPACRMRQLLSTQQWQFALAVGGATSQ